MKRTIYNNHTISRMTLRNITKDEIESVVNSKGGHIEMAGKVKDSKVRWKKVNGRNVAVVFVETRPAIHLITTYIREETR